MPCVFFSSLKTDGYEKRIQRLYARGAEDAGSREILYATIWLYYGGEVAAAGAARRTVPPAGEDSRGIPREHRAQSGQRDEVPQGEGAGPRGTELRQDGDPEVQGVCENARGRRRLRDKHRTERRRRLLPLPGSLVRGVLPARQAEVERDNLP